MQGPVRRCLRIPGGHGPDDGYLRDPRPPGNAVGEVAERFGPRKRDPGDVSWRWAVPELRDPDGGRAAEEGDL